MFHFVGECGVLSNCSLCNFTGVESLSNQVRVFPKFPENKVIYKESWRVDSECYTNGPRWLMASKNQRSSPSRTHLAFTK